MKKVQLSVLPWRFQLLLFLLPLLQSCNGGLLGKKDDPTPAGRKEQLSRAWKVDGTLVNGQPYAGTEFAGWQFDFRKDNTYTLMTGTQSGQGTWELTSSDSKLLLDKGSQGETVFTILQLDASRLDLEITQATAKNGEVKIVLQLKPR